MRPWSESRGGVTGEVGGAGAKAEEELLEVGGAWKKAEEQLLERWAELGRKQRRS